MLPIAAVARNDYLTCTCIYPPLEIATLTRGSDGKQSLTSTDWPNWDAALESVENDAVKDFVRAEISRHQESRLQSREVIYRVDGKRRFWLSCRKKYAYVWQGARFDGDEVYWKKILSEPGDVQQVNEKRALRFRLTTVGDFSAFGKAMSSDFVKVEFSEDPDEDPTSTSV